MNAAGKAELRQQIRAIVRQIPPAERVAGSASACAIVERQPEWKGARSVLFYAPLADELDIWPLTGSSLAAGKTVALPRFHGTTGGYVACRVQDLERDLAFGRFGIREPRDHCAVLDLNRLDLVLVPGVAFDLHGRRLGRGKGFYDRLLSLVRGIKCGVAFDEQIIPEIPVEPHDVHLDCILTPTRWIGCDK